MAITKVVAHDRNRKIPMATAVHFKYLSPLKIEASVAMPVFIFTGQPTSLQLGATLWPKQRIEYRWICTKTTACRIHFVGRNCWCKGRFSTSAVRSSRDLWWLVWIRNYCEDIWAQVRSPPIRINKPAWAGRIYKLWGRKILLCCYTKRFSDVWCFLSSLKLNGKML